MGFPVPAAGPSLVRIRTMNPPDSSLPRQPDRSVTTPIGPAIERTKRMLFQPFNLEKWFILGFCAWLAHLGERAGGTFNYPGGGGPGGRAPVDFHQSLQTAKDWLADNRYWLIPVVIAVGVLILGLWLFVTWLNSRGKFMFLHCVALDRAEVIAPWREYGREGNSLFQFNVLFGLAGGLLLFPLLGLIGWMIYRMVDVGEVLARELLVAIGAALVFAVVALVAGIVRKLTTDFVVPIMYLRRGRCLAAWREFWQLFTARIGDFVLYLLFQIVLGLALGVITLLVMVFTCCFCCLLLLPYLGTVVLLPLLVFARNYSVMYFAQHGSGYDVFPPPSAPGAGPLSPPALA